MTRLFILFILVSCAFLACKNEAKPTTQESYTPSKADIKAAVDKLDNLVPRYIYLIATPMLGEKQKIQKAAISIDGIGYPTKVGTNDTIFMNIAGVSPGKYNFKAYLTYTDSIKQTRMFTGEINDTTKEILPNLEPLKSE